MRKKYDIIWNMSLICPWDCSICCVDAINVKVRGNKVKIVSEGLTRNDTVERNRQMTIYDQALKERQSRKLEASLEDKIKILDNLEGIEFEIDFSGGDPLVCSENLEVIKYGAQKYSKENFAVTTTGAGLAKIKPEELIPYISKLEFTYDNTDEEFDLVRPRGYNNQNLRRAIIFARNGIKVKALTPLSKRNIAGSKLRLLYENLNKAGIEEVELMRYFPVGRGFGKVEEIPTREDYKRAIDIFKEMESNYGTPKVKLQCALKVLYADNTSENPCELYRKSLGITAKGFLLTSAWAIGPRGQPLDDIFVLGNLIEQPIVELLKGDKVKTYEDRLDENFGHCKIFAYLNSKKENSFDKLFDITDPLYIGRENE